jgi:flagellar biosynthesis protein FlhB
MKVGNLKLKHYFVKRETKLEIIILLYVLSIIITLGYAIKEISDGLKRDRQYANDDYHWNHLRVTYYDVCKNVILSLIPIFNTFIVIILIIDFFVKLVARLDKPIITKRPTKE